MWFWSQRAVGETFIFSEIIAAGKESKTARKRRKRREMANKAAEEELAEISLEQQVRNVQKWFSCRMRWTNFNKVYNFTKYTISVHVEAGPGCHHHKNNTLWKQWLYQSVHFK